MNKVYVFWTGDNEMNEIRKAALDNLIKTIDCDVVLITKNNLDQYILKEHPLHESYQYLSETHKADYLRTYFMNFHGGGYADIKHQSNSWANAYKTFNESDKWICGYREVIGGVAYQPYENIWYLLLGVCAFICKPQTEFTKEWYNEMILFLDSKLEDLKKYPAQSIRDCKEFSTNNYQIEWNEMLGRIFHRVLFKYLDKSMNILPMPIFSNYL